MERQQMQQIFISIEKEDGTYRNKDIMESTYPERFAWYNSMSKGQIVGLLEKMVNFKNKVK
jgi:hypothetical protein